MKVGQKTYNRGLGHGVITEITEDYYTIKYDKITVQYPHKDISYLIVALCLVMFASLFCGLIYLAV